ncbi:WavE lipopolysaccharide synthesis family protein [Vibrio cholerae]|uniref:WavE lipopolysaccharide synthesis family protein n=1 Tax=Vibrio cholerae TaxID=666 RepID=UPI000F0BBE6F|nr:WavE lipopolysaccharide synthesis family protein [Vibrio cholerae]EGR0892115.1 wavE lipopolysaccharide synthesis family protein [Vibrio cholerae]EKF9441013.1 WavE lipopolysaccharide synthesis family protein [Vibrio cholerae]EKJ1030401.1 WavE lipopolysaccharide synthesis family protein [Vibrio cholerae]ELN9188673.1 WavE lipopolysaccharide synthesis family protein [Vibrio cholerae]RNE82454.1 wavE lipopolysaccharide synthesis family protein [Vibrio cholerae]
MLFDQITFVIQGPITPSITSTSVRRLRSIFPGCQIIVSTWEGENTQDIDADLIIYNKDPGSTIFVYSKRNDAIPVNINRQIVSTVSGLRHVKTKFAAKLRADNILNKRRVLEIFEQFPLRKEGYAVLNNRLVCSNYFAKEFERGLSVPFFFSDFFQFGEVEDLLKVWDCDLYSDYDFKSTLSGKKQHKYYPNDSVNVEQKIWSNAARKLYPYELKDEHGDHFARQQSYNFMINNLIIVDGDELGLDVPQRLRHSNSYPYDFFTFQRWKWLYENEFLKTKNTPLNFKFFWYLSLIIKTIRKGVRLKLRKTLTPIFIKVRK